MKRRTLIWNSSILLSPSFCYISPICPLLFPGCLPDFGKPDGVRVSFILIPLPSRLRTLKRLQKYDTMDRVPLVRFPHFYLFEKVLILHFLTKTLSFQLKPFFYNSPFFPYVPHFVPYVFICSIVKKKYY